MIFDSDRELMNQYRMHEGVKLSIDPLGSMAEPFMHLPYECPLFDMNYFSSDEIEPEIQMDSAEKNILMDTQDERELRDQVEPISGAMTDFDLNARTPLAAEMQERSDHIEFAQ
jgi:hypothetical protein